jgi:hypothetical protein
VERQVARGEEKKEKRNAIKTQRQLKSNRSAKADRLRTDENDRASNYRLLYRYYVGGGGGGGRGA